VLEVPDEMLLPIQEVFEGSQTLFYLSQNSKETCCGLFSSLIFFVCAVCLFVFRLVHCVGRKISNRSCWTLTAKTERRKAKAVRVRTRTPGRKRISP
jgi:hypothetical protein